MAAQIRLIDPRRIQPNPENPRLIFRADELRALEDSIREQGILVPLTLFEDGKRFYLLDGERRWKCSVKLNLPSVPAIVQPKPDRLQNIMMMFAIHNARKDWDPLPTALKLQELEAEFTERQGRTPNESELAELASISRGEVRRLKQLLSLPERYRRELLDELEKPRSKQQLSVDHVLEATKGAAALRKRDIVDDEEEDQLRQAIITKFRSGVIRNTVDPRKLARIARAVEREEITPRAARRVTKQIIEKPKYSIDRAFAESVQQVDFEHGTQQLAERLVGRLHEHMEREYEAGEALAESLATLRDLIDDVLDD